MPDSKPLDSRFLQLCVWGIASIAKVKNFIPAKSSRLDSIHVMSQCLGLTANLAYQDRSLNVFDLLLECGDTNF